MNKNWLKVLVAISAVMIAGSAAYFSVTGLGVLFSGAAVAVMVMAGSLEFAKLVTATYLKQEWDNVSGINKWYLTGAVVILMAITSAGIFGYLSNAFQQQNLKLEQVQREIDVWNNKIKTDTSQIALYTNQLNQLQSNSNTVLNNNTNRSSLRFATSTGKEQSKIRTKISALNDSVVVYNSKINDIKNANIGIEREVGGFRFVAESFGVPLNSVVKFFIILIVIVFDPLAVALVISFNQLMLVTGKKKEEEDEIEPTTNPEDLKNFVDETVRLRLSEEDLKKLEEALLNPPKPNEALKEAVVDYNEQVEKKQPFEDMLVKPQPTQEERHELLTEMMKNDQELGLYDEPFDNPMIKNDDIDESYDVENGTEQLNEWDVTLMDGLEDEENIFHEEPTIEEEEQNFSTIEPETENIFQEEYTIPVDEAIDNEPELTFEEGQLPDDMLKVLDEVQTETFSEEPTTLNEQPASEEEEEKKN